MTGNNNISTELLQLHECDLVPCTIAVTDLGFIITMMLRHIEVFISIVGNGLVLTAVWKCSYLHMPTCYLISCLSICDIIGATLSPLIHFMAYHRGTQLWVDLCHFKLVLMIMFALGNLLFSFMIALERLITLMYPLTYMTIVSKRHVSACVLGAFMYLIGYTISLPITSHNHISTMRNTECLAASAMPKMVHNVCTIQLYFFTVGIILIYLLIGRIAWKKTRCPNEMMNNTSQTQWKITKMMASVILLYIACYMPLFLTDRMMKSNPSNMTYARYYYMSTVVYYISSWVNPLLYGYKSIYFRRAFCKTLPRFVFGAVFSKRIEDIHSPIHTIPMPN